MTLEKDESLVPFRGRAIAITLLNIADKLGYGPEVVKTTLEGYIVPTKVAKKFDLDKVDENAEPPEYAAEPFAPTSPANEPGAADPAGDVDVDDKSDEQKAAAAQAEQDRLDAEKQTQADADAKAEADAEAADAAEKQRLADEAAAAGSQAEPVTEPAKNGSRADWEAFARDKVARESGTWDDADDDLGRNELAEKFGTPEAQA